MCTPPQFIGGLVAHEFHASVRVYLGGESLARREAAQTFPSLGHVVKKDTGWEWQPTRQGEA